MMPVLAPEEHIVSFQQKEKARLKRSLTSPGQVLLAIGMSETTQGSSVRLLLVSTVAYEGKERVILRTLSYRLARMSANRPNRERSASCNERERLLY